MSTSTGDRTHLDRAALLAAGSLLDVLPNPPVGCVIVGEDGTILGEGFHPRFGGPHAEEEALRVAGQRARGGTAYLTLEPCGTDVPGKHRPPCAPRLVEAGVARVVCGAKDPSTAASGAGVALLRRAGILVDEIAHDPSGALLDDYRVATADPLPWTVAKWAMSLDGRTADARGRSRWISGEASRAVVHRLRASCDAIVVGARTAALDDPDLRPRLDGWSGPAPLRVVVDGALRLTPDSVLARTAREGPVLVATRACPAGERSAALLDAGVELLSFPSPDRGVDLVALFTALRRRGVRRVLLEGGGEITSAAFRAGLARQVAVFIAPIVLGGASAPAPVSGETPVSLLDAPRVLRSRRTTRVGDDLLVEGLL